MRLFVVRFAVVATTLGCCQQSMNSVGVDAFRMQPQKSMVTGQDRISSQRRLHRSANPLQRTFVAPMESSFSSRPSRFSLYASNKENQEDVFPQFADTLQRAFLPSLSVVWWPAFAAMGIPALVSFCRSFPPNSSEQIAAVTLLIVANRVYLYALGLTIVVTVSARGLSANDPKELGQRLTVLTEELLVLEKPLRAKADFETTEGEAEITVFSDQTKIESTIDSTSTPSFVKKMVEDSGLEENLDGVDAKTQALVLPALVAGLLALSVVTLPIWSEGFLSPSSQDVINSDAEWIIALQANLSKILPFLSEIWNAILLTLFTRAEFRRLGSELFGIVGGSNEEYGVTTDISEDSVVPKAQIIAECLLAVAVTGYGAYYLQYWPAQNFVNSAIAILVARAIRLDSFNAVVSALALLALYDGVSVLLIPGAANAAAIVDGAGGATIASSSSLSLAASTPASSAMGSVAMQKLTSGGFQPGLLVTKLDGDKITGTLGLGDAVFPSILASFLKRFDEDCNTTNDATTSFDKGNQSRLFEASLGGYVAGCLACEVVPAIATRGVPALVFIVPLMILSTVLSAVQAERFDELRQYNSNNSSNETKE